MPNYEFYVGLAQKRDQYYQDAYASAYRDLLAIYKSEVEVQKLLYDQLAQDKKSNDALLKLIQKPPENVAMKDLRELISLQKQYEALRVDAQKATQSNRLKASEQVEAKYKLPNSFEVGMQKHFQDYANNKGQRGQTQFYNNVKLEFQKLKTMEQKEVALAQYAFDLQAQDPSLDITELQSGLNVTPRSVEDIQIQYNKELKEEQQKYGVGVGADARRIQNNLEALIEKKFKDVVALEQQPDGSLQLVELYKTRVGETPTAVELSQMQGFQPIAPPTEQEILARTAEYYRPYGTKEFKEFMTTRETQAQEREQKKQKKAKLEAQARKAIVDSLPPYAQKLVPILGEVETIMDVEDEELRKKGAPERFGLMLTTTGDYDIAAGIDQIDQEYDDPLERQRAYAILARDAIKKRRAEREVTPNLLGD